MAFSSCSFRSTTLSVLVLLFTISTYVFYFKCTMSVILRQYLRLLCTTFIIQFTTYNVYNVLTIYKKAEEKKKLFGTEKFIAFFLSRIFCGGKRQTFLFSFFFFRFVHSRFERIIKSVLNSKGGKYKNRCQMPI